MIFPQQTLCSCCRSAVLVWLCMAILCAAALLCLTCTELPEVAFANSRMLQSLGLAVAFILGTGVCVAGKVYLLMTLLVVAIMFYVLAEYRLHHDNDDVFEDP